MRAPLRPHRPKAALSLFDASDAVLALPAASAKLIDDMRISGKFCTLLLPALALSACAPSRPGLAAPEALPDWRSIATERDRKRLRSWRSAWTEALRKAQAAGKGATIAGEGVLLQPDAALPWQAPPMGDYQCRVIKIGAKSTGLLDYIAYPAFNCRIRQEDRMVGFAKLTGSQRPIGHLLPTSGERMIFLGTLQLGDENRALRYGEDRERDMAGIIERIGDRRWRLVLPYPHFESTIDVLELIPRS
jgi:hypothetical protein